MATEKILNTRIQLKYDTLANWNASSFKLKAGELAIVSLGEIKDGTTAGDVGQHPVLFKVGTGNHTFSQLPFASALAADVYAWAKASEVKVNGKQIQFLNGETVVKSVDIPYITEGEAKGFISDALKAYSTTEQMNAAIKEETDRADAEEKRIVGLVNGINTRVGTLEGHVGDSTQGLLKDVADLKAAVGEGGSVADIIDAAIGELDSSASQAAGTDGLALSVSIVDGKLTAISGSIAAETYDAHGAAAAAQQAAEGKATELVNGLANGAVKTNTEAITAIKDDANIDSFADVVAELAKKQDNIPANTYDAYGAADDVKDYADKTFATIANLDKYALGYDSTNKKLYLVDETGAYQGAGIDATPFIKDGMLNDVSYDAASNTLTFTWNTDGESKSDTVVLSDILDPYVAADTDTIDMTINGVNISAEVKDGSITKTHLASALANELNAKATEADLTLAEGRIADLEGLVGENGKVSNAEIADSVAANGVNTAAIQDDAVTAAKLADDVVTLIQNTKVTNATNADVANSLTEAAKAEVKAVKVDNATSADSAKSLADSAKAEVKAVKVDNAVNADQLGGVVAANYALKTDAQDYANTAESNAKSYADGLAGNYATAEQGGKADTALQSVEAAAGSGLVVSAKAENKQTIGFDPNVVFVFNCGDADTLID